MKPGLVAAVVALVLSCGCGGPRVAAPAGDDVLRAHLAAGARAYAQNHAERAAREYGAALSRAELSDDPDGISAAARNLAVLHLDGGAWETAQELLDEAELHAAGPGDVAELRVLQARAHAGGADIPHARELLEQVLAQPEMVSPSTGYGAQLLLAELALRSGRTDEARSLAGELKTQAPAGMQGRRERLRAALAEQDQDWGEAVAARREEAAAWKAASDWPSMALALERVGNNLSRDGQVGPAVDAWLRAARSLIPQGEVARAEQILERCTDVAVKDPVVARRIQRLRKTIAGDE